AGGRGPAAARPGARRARRAALRRRAPGGAQRGARRAGGAGRRPGGGPAGGGGGGRGVRRRRGSGGVGRGHVVGLGRLDLTPGGLAALEAGGRGRLAGLERLVHVEEVLDLLHELLREVLQVLDVLPAGLVGGYADDL